METRDVEIARFAKRAAEYKRALEVAPAARAAEVSAVIAMIRGVCTERAWRVEDVHVVDLMAGSGVLTRALRLAGFRQVTPLEACSEMHPSDSADLGFQGIDAFRDLSATLAQLQPDVVVCLAGFHHLISYSGDQIDRASSLAHQLEVIESCVNALRDDGVFLLVDICECTNLQEIRVPPIEAWSAEGIELPAGLTDDEVARLRRTRSLVQYGIEWESIVGPVEKNCPVAWFRQVVDTKTVLGHKDVAISQALLRVLNVRYRGSWQASLFACPWVFDTAARARQFVLHKFGFLVEAEEDVDDGDVVMAMTQYLGFNERAQGRAWVKWGLLACLVKRTPRTREFDSVLILNVLLMCALLLLWIRIGGRLMYSPHGFDDLLGTMFGSALGAVGAVCVDALKRRFYRAD